MLQVSLGGVCFSCRLRYSENAGLFPPAPASACLSSGPVQIDDADWAFYGSLGMAQDAATEFSMLTAHFSDALMEHDRVIVHGVALRWQDRAYLICADSGVGKSTQARFLQELRPGAFGVICGDRPVLQFCPSDRKPCHSERNEVKPKNPPPFSPSNQERVAAHNAAPQGRILVYPSPWNGKENWHGAEAAPLAGIILLERGPENRLGLLSVPEAVLPLYKHMIHTARDAETVRRVAALESRLLPAVPLWKLVTHDVPASTRLLLDAVFVL